MNNKERVFCYIIIGFLAGVVICLIVDNIKKEKEKKISKRKKKHAPKAKGDASSDLDPTIQQRFEKKRTELEGYQIRVIKTKSKDGADEAIQESIKEGTPLAPEAATDLIDLSKESVEYIEEDQIMPSQSSDQTVSPKETSSRELASEDEKYTKISSQHGEDSLHKDLRKLIRKMNKEDVEGLIKNISFYSSDKPVTKRYETKFKNILSLIHFFYQIYKKHKLKTDRAEKFALILINNFEQLKNNSVGSITSNWKKAERGKTRKELMADEDLVLL